MRAYMEYAPGWAWPETRFLCPMCRKVIVRSKQADAAPDSRAVERALTFHLRDRHPVRWRLSRRWRRALREHDRLIEAGSEPGGQRA